MKDPAEPSAAGSPLAGPPRLSSGTRFRSPPPRRRTSRIPRKERRRPRPLPPPRAERSQLCGAVQCQCCCQRFDHFASEVARRNLFSSVSLAVWKVLSSVPLAVWQVLLEVLEYGVPPQ